MMVLVMVGLGLTDSGIRGSGFKVGFTAFDMVDQFVGGKFNCVAGVSVM